MKRNQEQQLRRVLGDLSSLCGIKDYVFNDGPQKGMRAFDLKNGRNLNLTVLPDRGLDIGELTFKGRNMAFNSKTGYRSPYLYTENGALGFLRQFSAGFLTTCGLGYAGAADREDGRELGLHGPYSNTPAGAVSARAEYRGDEAVLTVQGQVRQSCVFEENLLLSRTLSVETERDRLTIRDEIENQGFVTEPYMLVYHINFGYPMLDAGARVYGSARTVTPRDEVAARGLEKWSLMEEPGTGRPEECFFHSGHGGKEAFVMLHNEALGAACVIRFDAEVFPILCQWKCMRAGDYALGLEPTTSGVMGRPAARRDGLLRHLEPGERISLEIQAEFLDDAGEIGRWIEKAQRG